MTTTRSLQKRFDAKYVISAGGCWTWTAWRDSYGYGRIKVGGAVRAAHRVSFTLHRGPIPDGLFACHTCDNPPCVNPDHLFVGTRTDNAQDCVRKGRRARGEKHPMAQLTEMQAREIKDLAATGLYRHKDIASLYGVSKSAVSHIVTGTTWGHLAES